MSLLDRLFSRSSSRLTARQAQKRAREALVTGGHRGAAIAKPCCVYTSIEEANDAIDAQGRAPAWHVDFCETDLSSVYRVRVQGEKARVKEERTRGRFPSAEYLYAFYGQREPGIPANNLCPLPDSWIDSTNLRAMARRQLHEVFADRAQGEELDELIDTYEILTACLPALNLRYLAPDAEPKLLKHPAPSKLAWGLILAAEDPDSHDAVAMYIDAASGLPLDSEVFRFPLLAIHGHSADW